MNYIDTNIIVYAITDDPTYGKKCINILHDIQIGKIKACASLLVLVELIHVLVKLNRRLPENKRVDVRKNIEAVTSLPLVWLDLHLLVLERAAEYAYVVEGVDYVHIASMELNMVTTMLSADRELDKIPLFSRIDPLEY